MLKNVSFEQAIDQTIEFLGLMGIDASFYDKTVELDIDCYKATLPCDFNKDIQLRLVQCKDIETRRSTYFRSTTDSFYNSENKVSPSDLTFKIQDGIIYTSIKSGKVELAYIAVNTDDDGYPVIPDNQSFIRALKAYIKLESFTILHDMGVISKDVYDRCQQEYGWAVGDCDSEFNRLSLSEAETLANSHNRMLPDDNQFQRGFQGLGDKHIYLPHNGRTNNWRLRGK